MSTTLNASATAGIAIGAALSVGMLISPAVTSPTSVGLVYSVRLGADWTSTTRSPGTARASIAVKNTPLVEHAAERPSAETVRKLHADSGLTWTQLGKMFGVSRRAVHHWASGGRMNSANAERLAELVAEVRKLQGTTAEQRRAALFAPGADGVSIIDRYRSKQASGDGDVSGTPFTPGQLLGALHDSNTKRG